MTNHMNEMIHFHVPKLIIFCLEKRQSYRSVWWWSKLIWVKKKDDPKKCTALLSQRKCTTM